MHIYVHEERKVSLKTVSNDKLSVAIFNTVKDLNNI